MVPLITFKFYITRKLTLLTILDIQLENLTSAAATTTNLSLCQVPIVHRYRFFSFLQSNIDTKRTDFTPVLYHRSPVFLETEPNFSFYRSDSRPSNSWRETVSGGDAGLQARPFAARERFTEQVLRLSRKVFRREGGSGFNFILEIITSTSKSNNQVFFFSSRN